MKAKSRTHRKHNRKEKSEKAFQKIGLPAGSLVYVGDKEDLDVTITVFDFADSQFTTFSGADRETFIKKIRTPTKKWVNVIGLHNSDLVKFLGEELSISTLLLEDVLQTEHPPKSEALDEYTLILCKSINIDEKSANFSFEHFAIIFNDNLVITFQEVAQDCLDPIRKRLLIPGSRLQRFGGDYLACTIVDTIADNYLVALENLRYASESIEDQLLNNAEVENITEVLHQWRGELRSLRKIITPLHHALSTLLNFDDSTITRQTEPYFKDVIDHLLSYQATLDGYNELLNSLRDLHLSNISSKMNEIMKMLTVIATIFIPLTFLAGIYGMNFDYMPELHFQWAYPALLIVMVIVGLLMVLFFRRKKWL